MLTARPMASPCTVLKWSADQLSIEVLIVAAHCAAVTPSCVHGLPQALYVSIRAEGAVGA